MTWTDERIETLRRMAGEGMSAGAMAKELGGVTRNAVIGKMARMGIRGARPPNRPAAQRRKRDQSSRIVARIVERIARPKPKPVDQGLPPDKSSCSVAIVDLGFDHCRWPLGEPDRNMRYCGAAKERGAYCERHAKLAYMGTTKRLVPADDLPKAHRLEAAE